MIFTTHAIKQAQRRGVSTDWIDCVLKYGEEFKSGGGASLYRISAMDERYLKSEAPNIWRHIRDHKNIALVQAGDVVVTVMHRRKSLRKSNRLV